MEFFAFLILRQDVWNVENIELYKTTSEEVPDEIKKSFDLSSEFLIKL